MPFNIREKEYRIPIEDPTRGYKFRSDKSAQQIKSEVQKLKDRRMYDKLQKENEIKHKYEKNRGILRKIHEKQKKEKERSDWDEKDDYGNQGKIGGYADIRFKQLGSGAQLMTPPTQKITLQSLEKLTYEDINQGQAESDEFRPEDFLNDSDDEDLPILKRYKKTGMPQMHPLGVASERAADEEQSFIPSVPDDIVEIKQRRGASVRRDNSRIKNKVLTKHESEQPQRFGKRNIMIMFVDFLLVLLPVDPSVYHD